MANALVNPVQVGWGYYDKRGFLVFVKRKPRAESFPIYAEVTDLREEDR